MKLQFLSIFLLVVLSSCNGDRKNETVETVDYSKKELDVTTSIYPENITKVFEAHGGLDAWEEMQVLKFTIPKETGNEVTITNLYSRESHIDMPNHQIGYDGENVWLKKKDTTNYQGNPRFYYNLMFYFYAMPFVLADDGIIYENTMPLSFKGTSYPGIKISYESGVGESPEDEYIIYYNPKNYQMEWLGYTVTYFTNEKSKEWHFINYSEWQNVGGVRLPKLMTWYNVEDNLPTEPRNERVFTEVELKKEAMPQSTFEKPDSAEMIE